MAGPEHDDLPDDRITCATCVHMRGRVCAVKRYEPVRRRMRCEHYQPNGSDPDRRTGMERWPHLVPVKHV